MPVPGALTLLLVLFIARVLGQVSVLLFQPRWLPPMKDWYSGLLPYRFLLPAQIAIIALMIAMIVQVGSDPPPNRVLAYVICGFAAVYAVSMVIRFIILRRRHPDYRWYEGGMIPIMFHWVLAAFLFVYASERF
jgi:hypothetical protein